MKTRIFMGFHENVGFWGCGCGVGGLGHQVSGANICDIYEYLRDDSICNASKRCHQAQTVLFWSRTPVETTFPEIVDGFLPKS